MQANQVLDKAKEEYESLKTDLEAVREHMLDDFIDSSIVLAEKKLFPESIPGSDIEESARLEDVEYADKLTRLHNLYKNCHDLELEVRVLIF